MKPFFSLLVLVLPGLLFADTARNPIEEIKARTAQWSRQNHGYEFTLTRSIPGSFMGPEQGRERCETVLFTSGDFHAFKSVSYYDTDLVYRPPGTPGYREFDYTDGVNLVVWRKSRVYGICTSTTCERLEFSRSYTITPSGEITTSPKERVSRSTDNARAGMNWAGLNDLFLATGTRFADYLGEGSAAEEGTNADYIVSANYGNTETYWRVRLDEVESGLVRRAELLDKDRIGTGMVVETSGILQLEDLAVARTGQVIRSGIYRDGHNYTTDQTFHSGRKADQETSELAKEVRAAIIASVPVGGRVQDSRGEEPKSHYVRPEEYED